MEFLAVADEYYTVLISVNLDSFGTYWGIRMVVDHCIVFGNRILIPDAASKNVLMKLYTTY